MATMKAVAALAEVSQATVSHVINGTVFVSPKLKRRVLRAISELRYHPDAVAQTLRTKRSRTVGMIIPNISDPFFDTVVRGAEDVLSDAGYTLIIGNSDNDVRKEETYYRTFRGKRVDGILLIVSSGENPLQYLKMQSSEGPPIVYLDRYVRGLRGDSVVFDDEGGSYEAVTHLLKGGHRRIGAITGPLNLLNATMRFEGYKHALADNDICFDRTLVREGRFDTSSGEEKTKALLALSPRPTALYANNALMAVGALRAFKECGIRCPEDVALVSYNDLDWFDLFRPTITVIRQPVYDLGATAAETLLKRLLGKLTGAWHRAVLKGELVIRESSVNPNQQPCASTDLQN